MSQNNTISRRSLSFVAARGLALALAVSVGAAGTLSISACGGPQGNERWVATENTNVEIDWDAINQAYNCLLYTSPSPRDRTRSRMPSSA